MVLKLCDDSWRNRSNYLSSLHFSKPQKLHFSERNLQFIFHPLSSKYPEAIDTFILRKHETVRGSSCKFGARHCEAALPFDNVSAFRGASQWSAVLLLSSTSLPTVLFNDRHVYSKQWHFFKGFWCHVASIQEREARFAANSSHEENTWTMSNHRVRLVRVNNKWKVGGKHMWRAVDERRECMHAASLSHKVQTNTNNMGVSWSPNH